MTAAHNIDYRQSLQDDEQLLVRTLVGAEFRAKVLLVGKERSQADLAILEITDVGFSEALSTVTFAAVDRDNPMPVRNCWAVGFPQFGQASVVLPGGSHKDTWHVNGEILPGAKQRGRLLALHVTSSPRALPDSLAGSEWEGMSGAVVFASDPVYGQLALGAMPLSVS